MVRVPGGPCEYHDVDLTPDESMSHLLSKVQGLFDIPSNVEIGLLEVEGGAPVSDLASVLHLKHCARTEVVFLEAGVLDDAGEGKDDGEAVEGKIVSVGDKVMKRDGENDWVPGFIVSLEPLTVTASYDDPNADGYTYDEVKPLPGDRLLVVGDKVEKRDGEKDWSPGFIVSLEPLTVTASYDNPEADGYPYDEIRSIPGGRFWAVGDEVEERDEGEEWRKGWIASLDPLKVRMNTEDPQAPGFSWNEVRPLPSGNLWRR